jgi:tetratricopeptide (TPR) repeat protein
LNGTFRVFGDDDRDITPVGMKERGLLALLLASPGQRRTRIWLQSLLWSDREPHQASGSMRQALSNVRKALGVQSDRLCADRTTLWFQPEVTIDDREEGEFLGDLDIRDPEFSDWLRDRRIGQEHSAAANRPAPLPQAGLVPVDSLARPLVELRWTDMGVAPRSRFLTHAIAQRIAGDLILFGNIDVIQSDADNDGTVKPGLSALVEMECFGDAGQSQLLIRVIGFPARRIVWTGRLSLDMSVPDVWESAEASRCVNRAVSSVVENLATSSAAGNPAVLSRAVKLIYSFDRSGLRQADDLLTRIQDTEMRGLALAWRGFIRLTSALEFRDHSPDGVAEARGFADDALRAMADHPVVLSLASRIRLKMDGDVDHAHYLALRAAEMSDQNPYALEALGQTLIFHGNYQAADQMAQRARTAAQGLTNGFNWDMQACLTSLGLGHLQSAREAAAECHRKMPFYRPALRYLVALSLLADDRAEAEHHADRLRRIEPDFKLASLTEPDYPVETLRVLGYAQSLQERLQA